MKQSKLMIMSNFICAVLVLLSVIAYLICSFYTGLWHPAWIIIVLTASVCGIISISTLTIDKLRKKD